MPSLRGRHFSLRGMRGATSRGKAHRSSDRAPRPATRTPSGWDRTMFSSSPLDWGLIVLYFGFLVAVWALRLGRTPAAADYLVAGRRVTLPAFVATLVTTFYGGILGVGEYSWRYGIANWLVFGVPYYIGALLFALLFAKRAREAALYTMPDLLDRSYGRGPAMIGAVSVFVSTAPAA